MESKGEDEERGEITAKIWLCIRYEKSRADTPSKGMPTSP